MATKSLQWRGGLHTSIDPGLIEEGELQAGSNFLAKDGNLRLDRRYIQAYDHASTGSLTARGSGWGKFGTGALSNQYVAVLGTTLYEYDLTTTLARVSAATGLHASDWFFAQFANYLYGVNATDGVGRKLLGAGSNGHGDWTTLALPTTPTVAPTATQDPASLLTGVFTGGTLTVSGSPTTHAIQADGSILVVWPSTAAGVQTISITFKTATPDNRLDWTYHDGFSIPGTVTPGFTSSGPFAVDVDVYSTSLGSSYIRAIQYNAWGGFAEWRVNNIARSNRAQVTKLVFTTNVPSSGGTMRMYPPQAYGVWLTLSETTVVPNLTTPSFQPLQYEYTYYNSTTGLESAPSPQLLIPASQQNVLGEWRTVTAPTTAESGVDYVRFYRRVEEGGAITRYRLGSAANSGTPTYTDKLTLDEVKALTIWSPSILPTTGLTAIVSWLNRLVLAAGPLCYISRDDNPLAFAGAGQVFDPSDEGRALTYYPDDKQAENILALIAQDALFIVTDQSIRCLFGTTPDNWRNVKVEGAEGACGARAACGYKRGCLVLTPSGRLMYHTLGLTNTAQIGATPSGIEVSAKIRAVVGNNGMKTLATSDAIVSVRPDGEIEVRNQTGAYYVLDIDGNWRSGTHTHPTHSVLFITGLPLRWVGTNGYLYTGGDDTYVSDGGTSGTNGTAVYWSVTTKEDRMPRANLSNVYIRSNQTAAEQTGANTAVYPGYTPVTRRNQDNPTRYVADEGANVAVKRNKSMPANLNGEEFWFVIDGDSTSVVKEIRVSYDLASPARQA